MKKLMCATVCALPMMAMAAPKYAVQVDHFALKKNQNWTWANLSKTPKSQMAKQKAQDKL